MRKLITLMIAFICCIGMWADEHYLVGGCTDSDWETGEKTRSAVRAYTSDGTNWAWAGYINAASDEDGGRFKIPNSSGGWSGFWAKEQNTKITSEGVDLSTDGTDDRKFRLAEVGHYLITFNTRTMKIYAQTLSAASQDGDYYLISSVDDYYWFAAYIASDEHRNAKAKLTADLDFSGKTFIPLASERYPFTGEFDGQCHTIINAVVNENVGYSKIGLFSCVSSGANIHDLVIGETCSFSGWAKVAGIAGHALGGGDSVGTVTLRNIINMADVTSTGGTGGNEGHTSGFIACCNGNVKLSATNCANTGDIDGQKGECAAFVGWNGTEGTSFTNCWNIGTIAEDDMANGKPLCRGENCSITNCYGLVSGQGDTFSDGYEASGKLCYLLNGNVQGGVNWYQNLSGTVDAYPVPFSSHKKVYKFGSAESYLNDGSDVTISSATDLDNFSQVVNDGATSLNANLNAEISATTTFTPIGTDANMYKGTFNGNNHSITLSIDNDNSTISNRALIGFATGGATIQNLILKGSVKSEGSKTAGFIAEANGGGTVTITNCGNEATITGGGGETAAIIANNSGASCTLLLTNVYNIANVSGSGDVSTICGYQGNYESVFTNVYNSGVLSDTDGDLEGHFARGTINQNSGNPTSIGTYTRCYSTTLNSNTRHDNPEVTKIRKIEASDVSSGKLCYLLNENNDDGTNWTQTIGTDANPVPFNTRQTVHNASTGCYTNLTVNGSNTVQIGNVTELEKYAKEVNAGNTALNAELINDIATYSGSYIGDDEGNAFTGVFDGKGKKITISYDKDESKIGLFKCVTGGTIQNLIVDGTINARNSHLMSGLINESRGSSTYRNIVVAVNMSTSHCGANDTNADGTHGGVVSVAWDVPTVENVAFVGSINAPKDYGTCGIIGFAHTGGSIHYRNCYVTGTLNLADDNNRVFGRNGEYCENCYTTLEIKKLNDDDRFDGGIVTTAEVSSGKLCYLLNGNNDDGTNWTQTIGTDAIPVPFNTRKTVHSASTGCYTNLTVNGSNTVQIGNVTDLEKYAKEVNAGNTALNAELTQDIEDMSSISYTPIGSTTYPYTGHFDGQGHIVNLALDNPSLNYQGLFGVVTDGVKIEKVVVTGFVSGKDYVGGIVGGTNGGSSNARKTDIWYCGNEATITAAGANAGGIIGVNMSGSASIILTNCYNSGNITGARESGALSGWLGGGWSSVRNCYNTGTVKNGDTDSKAFGRNNGCFFKNCYYTASSGTDNSTENTGNGRPIEVADDAVGSGVLCAKLGYGFRQNLGEDAYPNFNVDHGFVNQISDAGYSTQYNAMSDVTIPVGVEAFAGVKNGSWVTLVPVKGKIKAGEPVVLKSLTPGCYNFMPTTGAEEPANNDLRGSDGSEAFGENIYVLANKSHGIGFYKTEGSGKYVPEGRAYLDNSGSSVKEAYFFSFDDEENETAITNVNVNGNGNNAAIYNMAGQRISKLQKGINIVNGKKVLF